jgi:hypothetical protein
MVTVPRLEPTTIFCTLGAYVNPGGIATESISILCFKSVEFARLIQSSILSRQAAYWAFILYFKPQLGYSLSTIPFNRD